MLLIFVTLSLVALVWSIFLESKAIEKCRGNFRGKMKASWYVRSLLRVSILPYSFFRWWLSVLSVVLVYGVSFSLVGGVSAWAPGLSIMSCVALVSLPSFSLDDVEKERHLVWEDPSG